MVSTIPIYSHLFKFDDQFCLAVIVRQRQLGVLGKLAYISVLSHDTIIELLLAFNRLVAK